MSARVVVTGLGVVSPLGATCESTWDNILAGKSGVQTIDAFDTKKLPVSIAGMVPGPDHPHGFDPESFVPSAKRRAMGPFIVYALAAAGEALKDAQWSPDTDYLRHRSGVMIASGIGGIHQVYEASVSLSESRRISPYFIPSMLPNMAAGHVSIRYGLKGPQHATVTACAAGSHAIGDAARLIACGQADVMVAGGAEGAVCPLGLAGFGAMRTLSTKYQDRPQQASRPWDKGRDGFVMGDGAGILVLERLSHAKKRGARIYAELVGYGLSGDGHHFVAPCDNGDGAFRAMCMAQKTARIHPEDIGYINAHGTSTRLGDLAELRAIRRFFKGRVSGVSVSSTKSSIGHLLGAAGGVEAVFCVLAIRDNMLPPTLNLHTPEEEAQGFHLVPHVAQQKEVDYTMSNSFGFGGTNACLIFKKFHG